MKFIILLAGIMAACSGVAMGIQWQQSSRCKMIEIARLEEEIRGVKGEFAAWDGLKQEKPLQLAAAYAAMSHAIFMVSGRYHAVCAVNVEGGPDEDVAAYSVSSEWSGLRELRLKVVFSGISRRGMQLSLLDALSSLEKAVPALTRRVYFEKDTLTIDLVVIGTI